MTPNPTGLLTVIGLIIGIWNRPTMYLQDICTTGPLSSYYRKKIHVKVFPTEPLKLTITDVILLSLLYPQI